MAVRAQDPLVLTVPDVDVEPVAWNPIAGSPGSGAPALSAQSPAPGSTTTPGFVLYFEVD